MRFLSLSFVLLVLVGCSPAVSTQGYRPQSESPVQSNPLGLFAADGDVLSELEIHRILDTPWDIPEHIRVSILPLYHRSQYQRSRHRWFEESVMGHPNMGTASKAVQALVEIPEIYDCAYLPSFLVPKDRSIANLRAAASRYQSDWVLLYCSSVMADPQYHTFSRNEVYGLCLVECAILDVRTGLMPFVGRFSQDFHVQQSDKGENMNTLVANAEQEAVNAALLHNVRSLEDLMARVRIETD